LLTISNQQHPRNKEWATQNQQQLVHLVVLQEQDKLKMQYHIAGPAYNWYKMSSSFGWTTTLMRTAPIVAIQSAICDVPLILSKHLATLINASNSWKPSRMKRYT
jgi:hypothetical protein